LEGGNTIDADIKEGGNTSAKGGGSGREVGKKKRRNTDEAMEFF